MNDMKKFLSSLLNIPPMYTLAVYCILAVTLFYFYFSPLSLRLDEAQTLWQTGRSIDALLNLLATNVHVPLYHLIVHEWQLLFGNNIFTIRLISLLFFVVSIPALYRLCEYTYGRGTALLATLLFTLSPFMNWFASEARMYTLLVFVTILSHYFYIKILRHDRFLSAWAWYTATACVGVFVHYFFSFVLLTQAIFFLLQYRRHDQAWQKALFSLLGTALLVTLFLVPWLLKVYGTGAVGEASPILARPSTIDFFNVFTNYFFGFQSDYINSLLLSLWPLIVLLSFFALTQSARPPSRETWYFLLSIAVPLAIAFISSIYLRPLFLSRYLIIALPSILLIFSALILSFPKRTAFITGVMLVALVSSSLTIQIFGPQSAIHENYKATTEYVSIHARPQDIVIVSAPFTIYPIYYYYTGQARIITFPEWNRFDAEAIQPFSEEVLEQTLTDLQATYQTVWLIVSYDQGYESQFKNYFTERFMRTDVKTFSPQLEVYAYKLRYDVDYKEDLLRATPNDEP
jgi:mannosyltransferase